MKNEEGTYKQGKFLSNKLKPEGLRVDPVRGSAQGAYFSFFLGHLELK